MEVSLESEKVTSEKDKGMEEKQLLQFSQRESDCKISRNVIFKGVRNQILSQKIVKCFGPRA